MNSCVNEAVSNSVVLSLFAEMSSKMRTCLAAFRIVRILDDISTKNDSATE